MRLVDPTGGRGERARRPAAEGGEEKFVPLGGSRRAAVERKGPATTTTRRRCRRTDLEPGRGGRDADREPARSVRRDCSTTREDKLSAQWPRLDDLYSPEI